MAPAGDDALLRPADPADVAVVRVDPPDISGPEPPLLVKRGWPVGAKVAAEYLRAPGHDLPLGTVIAALAAAVDHAHPGSWQCDADAARDAFVVGVRQHEAGLGQAIALERALAEDVDQRVGRARGQRRASSGCQPQPAATLARRAPGEQPLVDRRSAEHHRRRPVGPAAPAAVRWD